MIKVVTLDITPMIQFVPQDITHMTKVVALSIIPLMKFVTLHITPMIKVVTPDCMAKAISIYPYWQGSINNNGEEDPGSAGQPPHKYKRNRGNN